MTSHVTQPQRRSAILAAAEKEFDTHGYAATTMDSVAATAGISKGSVYNYFKSKQELFSQIFLAQAQGGIAAMERIIAADISPRQKLSAIVEGWFRMLDRHERIGRLVLEFWATAAREEEDGQIRATFRGMYGRWRDIIASVLAQGVADGSFTLHYDPRIGALLIVALVDGIIVQAILNTGMTFDANFLAAIQKAILANVIVNPALPQGRPVEETT